MLAANTLRTPLWLVTAVLLAAAGLLEASQDPSRQGRPDQVLVQRTNGSTRIYSGSVQSNALDEVVLEEEDGDTRRIDGASVLQVTFNRVPQAFVNGQDHFSLSEWELAAAQFRIATSDPTSSEPVQAVARLMAGRSLLASAASDRTHFAEAQAEFESFINEHPGSRGMPEARFLRARATHLAGDASSAGEQYLSLFAEENAGSPAVGYDLSKCYVAGLRSAEAFLRADEIDRAQAAYERVGTAASVVLPDLDPKGNASSAVACLEARARLGAGHCMRARGSADQAVTFFRREVNKRDLPASARIGARLGLAESLLDAGKTRSAQIEFATVSALERSSLDPTDRDRRARALLGLARCAVALGDTGASASARQWLDHVVEQLGDTAWVPEAQELLKQL